MAALDYSQYPLDGTNRIRLISLAPPTVGTERRSWQLEVCDLDRTQYYAVSYRWGAPLLEGRFGAMSNEPDTPLSFGDVVVKVTQNLASFLAQVEASSAIEQQDENAIGAVPERLDLSSAKFWVDAICINQLDPAERSEQVSTMMARIYESAQSVIAWLGEADEHTERAFIHLKAVAGSNVLPAFGVGPQSAYLNETVANIVSSRKHWESTAKIFERTYWNRAWIIQEVVLAKQVIVSCGRFSTTWDVLSKASHNISTGTWKQFFEDRDERMRIQNLTRARSSSYGIPTVLRAVRDSRVREHWTTVLMHSLIRSRSFEATHAEDKVYCLLGLIQDSVDVGRMPLLHPEFGHRSAGRAYLNVAIQLLRDCEDLLVLASVEGRSFQCQTIDGQPLPSWVSDWSCTASMGLKVTGYKRYGADSCFVPPDTFLAREAKIARWPIRVDEDERKLTLQAVKIDEICYRGETKDDFWKGKPFPRTLSLLLSLPAQYTTTGESGIEAFWRTLIVNTAGEERVAPLHPSFMGPGFAKWFERRVTSVMTTLTETPEWNEVKRRFSNFCSENREWHSLLTAPDTAPASLSSGSAQAEYAATFAHARLLRPFLTAKGYLGLGSHSLQEGDTIWVVPRSKVPLIFRRVLDAESPIGYHCELVGGAYLHGFMDGRALALMAARNGREVQDSLETVVIR